MTSGNPRFGGMEKALRPLAAWGIFLLVAAFSPSLPEVTFSAPPLKPKQPPQWKIVKIKEGLEGVLLMLEIDFNYPNDWILDSSTGGGGPPAGGGTTTFDRAGLPTGGGRGRTIVETYRLDDRAKRYSLFDNYGLKKSECKGYFALTDARGNKDHLRSLVFLWPKDDKGELMRLIDLGSLWLVDTEGHYSRAKGGQSSDPGGPAYKLRGEGDAAESAKEIKPRPALRIWHVKMAPLEASLYEWKGEEVALKKGNGIIVRIPLDSLAEADVEWLKQQPDPKPTPAAVGPGAGFRTWSDPSGFDIQAKLIARTPTEVVLCRPDGKILQLKIDVLSREDKEYLDKSWPSNAASEGAASKP